MPRKVTLYPIYALARAHDDHPFDAVLPYHITDDVALEDVTNLFNAGTWDWVGNELGLRDLEELRGVRHALVHRYATPENPQGGNGLNQASIQLMHNLAALLRLVRPMRQMALLMQGELQEGNTLNVQHFEHPIGLLDVPQVQKLFHLRNRDAESLRALAPRFLAAMQGEYWKLEWLFNFMMRGTFKTFFGRLDIRSGVHLWKLSIRRKAQNTEEAMSLRSASNGFWDRTLQYIRLVIFRIILRSVL